MTDASLSIPAETNGSAVAEAKKGPPRRIQTSDMKPLDSYVYGYAIIVPVGTTIEHMLVPDYWASIADRLPVNTLIQAFAEDGSWEAQFRVRTVGHQWAQVGVLGVTRWDEQLHTGENINMVVEWGGPSHKWRVRRITDDKILSYGHANREQAHAEIPGLMKAA